MSRRLAVGAAAITAVLVLGVSPAAAADSDGDGVGNARDRCPTFAASQSDGCPLGRWAFRNTNTNGAPNQSFRFASLAGQPVVGDWDGDGDDNVGTYDRQARRWHLAPSRNFGDTPGLNGGDMIGIAGDWNGDGKDTVGLYVPSTGTFYLRNSNTAGPADLTITFGGDQPARFVRPVAGDWNGDGTDSVGIFRRDSNRWRLRDTNSSGPADYDLVYGRAGNAELPITGDVDGDGDDSVGITYRGTQPGQAHYQALPDLDASGNELNWSFGEARDGPLGVAGFLGDWDGDGDDTGGVRR